MSKRYKPERGVLWVVVDKGGDEDAMRVLLARPRFKDGQWQGDPLLEGHALCLEVLDHAGLPKKTLKKAGVPLGEAPWAAEVFLEKTNRYPSLMATIAIIDKKDLLGLTVINSVNADGYLTMQYGKIKHWNQVAPKGLRLNVNKRGKAFFRPYSIGKVVIPPE